MRPVVQSTGPGTPMPMPRTLERGRPTSRQQRRARVTVASTAPAPWRSSSRSPSRPAPRRPAVPTASRPWVAPRSAASTVVVPVVDPQSRRRAAPAVDDAAVLDRDSRRRAGRRSCTSRWSGPVRSGSGRRCGSGACRARNSCSSAPALLEPCAHVPLQSPVDVGQARMSALDPLREIYQNDALRLVTSLKSRLDERKCSGAGTGVSPRISRLRAAAGRATRQRHDRSTRT